MLCVCVCECVSVCVSVCVCVCVCEVSTDIRELRQAVHAYHRVLDLQGKFTDIEVSIHYCVYIYVCFALLC